jgi:hypothetical protein
VRPEARANIIAVSAAILILFQPPPSGWKTRYFCSTGARTFDPLRKSGDYGTVRREKRGREITDPMAILSIQSLFPKSYIRIHVTGWLESDILARRD